MLIDCAHAPSTLRWLEREKINRLRFVIATHSDGDHIAGIAIVIRNFKGTIDYVLYHPDGRRVRDRQQAYRQILQAVETHRLSGHPASTGCDTLLAKLPLEICRILYPTWERLQLNLEQSGEPNRSSAAVYFEKAGYGFLISGDLEADGWSHLRDEKGLPRSHVFLLPHHGGEFRVRTYVPRQRASGSAVAEPAMTSAELLHRVAPTIAVISSGSSAKSGFPPQPSVLASIRRYASRASGFRLLCTEISRHCATDPLEHRDRALTCLLPENCEGRCRLEREHSPCAGAVVITISASGRLDVSPEAKQHNEVVRGLEHAQCRSGAR